MTRAALSAVLSHWRRRPVQLVTLVLGLALATALWSGVQAINAEARASYARAAETLGQTRLPRIVRADGAPMDDALFGRLRRAGWPVSPVIEGQAAVGGALVTVLGVEPLTAPAGLAPRPVEDDGSGDLATFITPPGQLYASAETAARIGPDAPPVIVAEGIAPGIVVADIGIAQGLLRADGLITRLVLPPGETGPVPLAGIDPALVLQPPSDGADIGRLTDSFHLNLTAFGLLSFAVGLFIVRGTVGLAFEQRRPMIRTLRALGLPLSVLMTTLLAELVLIAAVAGTLGMALGYVIAAALLPDVAATLRGLYAAPVEGTLSLRPAWWAAGLGMTLAGTLLAAAASLWQIARMPILAPARPRAWSMATARGVRAYLIAAAALAALAVLTLAFGTGLVSGFVMLGALMVAAALLLPPVLDGILRLAARAAPPPVAEWVVADTRQQLPGLSLALMALLLALAANIGVGTMVSSFRLTFTGWLDQRLASELYVTAADETQAARLRTWLDGRADRVLPIWNVDGIVLGRPAEIYGVADDPTYRDNWPMLDALPDAWDRVAAGRGVLVNEQLSRGERLGPGDSLTLPGGFTAPVVGVYSDYGNPLAQVLVGLPVFERLYPDAPRLRYGLRVDAGRADALRTALVQDFGLNPEGVIDQASLKRYSLDVFERTFAVSAALNVLTLGVACVAILTSLLTLGAMRLPQLAPVWAVGMTRARLARFEMLRALLLAALTAVAAIPVGLLLAWVLLAVINVEAFGWRLPMHLFPADWLRLGLLALVAAGLAALWPALALRRLPPDRLLRVFADER